MNPTLSRRPVTGETFHHIKTIGPPVFAKVRRPAEFDQPVDLESCDLPTTHESVLCTRQPKRTLKSGARGQTIAYRITHPFWTATYSPYPRLRVVVTLHEVVFKDRPCRVEGNSCSPWSFYPILKTVETAPWNVKFLFTLQTKVR